MSIKIIVDSTTDMPPASMAQVSVVPLNLSFGEETYIDGVTIDKKTFYEKLTTSDVLPKTSQPAPAAFESVYKEVTANGDSALVITIASELSGTYQSACIAAEDYPNVKVIDSGSASIGVGILIQYAFDCLERGMDLETLFNHLEQQKKNLFVLASVDTLEYLQKGGRISKSAAAVGGILNIKPVLSIKDGEISLLGMARGSKKSNNFLIQKTNETGIDYSKPVLLGYTGNSDKMLCRYAQDSRSLWEGHIECPEMCQLSSVVGTHAGPGGVVVGYFMPEA